MLMIAAPGAVCFSTPIWVFSMPTSPSPSIGSREPFETASARDQRPPPSPAPGALPERLRWRLPAFLFVLTVGSILYTAARTGTAPGAPVHLSQGIPFTLSLLAILLTHEFAHYIYARYHGVNTSLPLFIPLPMLTQFGTLGAVILMRDRIKSRNALVDIGASGPLAGMMVAIPVLLYGLAHSEVHPLLPEGEQEGQSLLYWLAKRIVFGPIPEGWDVYLNPVALAGWVGLLITMLNLLPWGQLDGGHVAYALLGPRQHVLARWFRRSLLVLFVYTSASFMLPVLHGHSRLTMGMAFLNSWFWLVWYLILGVIGRFSGGAEHPATEPGTLSP